MSVDIRRPAKKFLPHFVVAQEQNLYEADTVQRVIRFLEQVLGYNPMTEITREKQVKDKYVDLAVKVEDVVKFLIEVKSAGTELRDRHIEQAQHYAAEDNLRWVVLTNGVVWTLYHLTFEDGVEYERLFSVNLSTELDRACECLSLLHRSSVRKDKHEEYWDHRSALDAESIGKALFTQDVLRSIRRGIRRNEGLLVDEEDLATAIHGLFSVEAREKIGPMRVRRRRKATKSKAVGAAIAAVDLSEDAKES